MALPDKKSDAERPSLRYGDLQDLFQKAILEQDDGILDEIFDSSREQRSVLLGVYREAYVLRLRDFLVNDYAQLQLLVGDDQFDEIASKYIACNRSKTRNARWYGGAMPAFLAATRPYSEMPWLAELTAMEQALDGAFDADDDDILAIEDLAAIAPDSWPTLTFAPHPSVRRLNFAWNTLEIWQTLADQMTVAEPQKTSQSVQLIVYRTDHKTHYRPMAADEAMMWDEMSKGAKFGALCELMAVHGGEDGAAMRAASYLRVWLDAHMLSSSPVSRSRAWAEES